MKPLCSDFPVLQRLHFSHSAPVARSAVELSGQKGLDQFPCECCPNHFSSQTEDIHIVIFDALMSGENIMDEPGTHSRNFIRGDGRTHTAATQRYPTSNLLGSDGSGHGDDEIRVVISGVELMCAEVHNLVARAMELLRHLLR